VLVLSVVSVTVTAVVPVVVESVGSTVVPTVVSVSPVVGFVVVVVVESESLAVPEGSVVESVAVAVAVPVGFVVVGEVSETVLVAESLSEPVEESSPLQPAMSPKVSRGATARVKIRSRDIIDSDDGSGPRATEGVFAGVCATASAIPSISSRRPSRLRRNAAVPGRTASFGGAERGDEGQRERAGLLPRPPRAARSSCS
jgi:hypothetical protein